MASFGSEEEEEENGEARVLLVFACPYLETKPNQQAAKLIDGQL